MRVFLGTGLFGYAALLIGYIYALFIRSYVHFYEKPSGDILISVLFLVGSFLAFRKLLQKNEQLKYVILATIPMALFSLKGFFWFYANTDYLLLYNYVSTFLLGFALASIFKFPITEKRFKIHYLIFFFFAIPGFLIAFFSRQFDLVGTLILFVMVAFASREWKEQKALSLAVIVISLGLLIVSFRIEQPKFFESQKKYEDLVLLSEETKFQKVDVTTWKGNYWYYQNGVNHFSTIDSWLYFEPFVYPALSLINPEKVLIVGGENGLIAAELLKQGLSIDLLPIDPEFVAIAREEELFTKFNLDAFSNEKLNVIDDFTFDFLVENKETYDLVFVDAPDPVDVLTNQFYTQEFYVMIDNVLMNNGLFITQSGSPYYATEAFEMLKRTIQSVGFKTTSFHNQVLSLGEWSWIIGSKNGQLKSELEKASFENFDTKWLNHEAMQMMLSFGKSKIAVDSSLNTMADPKLFEYYLEGNFGLR